jgi:hypothetical protein
MNSITQYIISKVAWFASRVAILAAAIGLASISLQPVLANAAGLTDSSLNWAGYTATSGSYTGVSGTWTIPAVTGNTSLSADAAWVGVGGVSSNDLIQAGTQAIAQNGTVQYQAWYEILPQVSQIVNLPVKNGDSITASITQQSTGVWLVVLQDNTSGQTYQQSVQYSSSLSSAEWIEEMPMSGNTLLPLDNFNSINFSNASAIKGGVRKSLSQSGATAISMLNNFNQTLASPSAVGSDGQSFTVTEATQTADTSSGSGVTVRSYDPSTHVVRGFGHGGRSGLNPYTGNVSSGTGTSTATSTGTSTGSSTGYSVGSYVNGENPLSWFLQQWQNELNSLNSQTTLPSFPNIPTTTQVTTPATTSAASTSDPSSSDGQWQQVYKVQISGGGSYTIYVNNVLEKDTLSRKIK